MDITQITNIISTIGFPIVMCIIIVKYLVKEITSLKDILSDTKNVIAELKQLIQDKLA